MKKKLLIVLGLLVFCHLYVLQLQLVESLSTGRFDYHPDAPFFLFLDCLISIYSVQLARRWFRRRRERHLPSPLVELGGSIPIFMAGTLAYIILVEQAIFGKPIEPKHLLGNMVVLSLLHLIIGSVYIAINYFSTSTRMSRKLLAASRAHADTQIKLLQQQLDPHFLFNNLNVLSSLVHKDADRAEEFIHRFAELYRHMLQVGKKELTLVSEEIMLLQHYIYLIDQRFPGAYQFQLALPEGVQETYLPSGTLQLLAENVIKHNQVNYAVPLKVKLYADEDRLVMENQRRNRVLDPGVSTGTGLTNLRARYTLLTDRQIVVKMAEELFSVQFPVIKVLRVCK
ncbi:histidine kinase [Chitinophaga pendula]|uniref:sensor histidine kinase n=1 Tax=Chitinophaga TaxID=79328 RepID=UPI000BB0139E|nr:MULTISPECIES: histidine kinase [Chitinophaga]ASZ14403.1 hypothetical protein CK934_27405 [Chitinophaga sp. MD30]UCJ07942.1 histidine kinase [Chitinophaga pendula]